LAFEEIIAAIGNDDQNPAYFHSQHLRRRQPYCSTSIPTL
jgi:hypothetical protein